MDTPETRHLGTLSGPVLIFGGVYGNLEAFEALLEEARRLRIPTGNMIHTGDVAAYCADTYACASRLREIGCPTIKGNVEEQLASGAADCACGFDEGSECDLLAMRWYALANRQTTAELRRWMADMPDHLTFDMAGCRFRVVHGGPRLVNEFVFASQPESVFQELLDMAAADCVIAGHSGLPFTRRVGERVWHNSGGLGMPANDGTPRVWYSLVSPQPGGISFSCHALGYDHFSAAAKMRKAGLPEGYASGLESGIWPSTDILPRAEAAATGEALAPPAHLWERFSAAAE